MNILLFVVMVIGLVLPEVSVAQEASSCGIGATQPDVKVGDSWVYRYKNTNASKWAGSYTEEVIGIDMNSIRVRVSGSRAIYERVYDKSWNIVNLNPRVKYTQPLLQFVFPIGAGDGTLQEMTVHADYSVSVRDTYKVLGCDKITVPAGTFEAVKIVISGPCSGEGTFPGEHWGCERRRELWYSPIVKKNHKETFWGRSPTGVVSYVRELESFSVK
jgi:hypothetical protein